MAAKTLDEVVDSFCLRLKDIVVPIVLQSHPVCEEAGMLLNDFRLFLDQGFITGLKKEAAKQYLDRLNDIVGKIGKDRKEDKNAKTE